VPYISLFDELGLDLDSLKNMNAQGIIRLEKQLKAKAMLGHTEEQRKYSKLISQLKDEDIREIHIFIEYHPWLKKLITEDFESISTKDFTTVSKSIDSSKLINFLQPYFLNSLRPCMSFFMSRGYYTNLLFLLEKKLFFTERIKQTIVQFLKSKLNFAFSYIQQKKHLAKITPVNFISDKTFIKCLNSFPNNFNAEIQDVNSEIIKIYNARRGTTSNSYFRFAAKTMVAFGTYETLNLLLSDNLKTNATIAREYVEPNFTKKTSRSLNGALSLILILVIAIGIVFYVGEGFKSKGQTPKFNDEFMQMVKKENLLLLSQINSQYPRIVLSRALESLDYKLYDNPYKPIFQSLQKPKTARDILKSDTYIHNKTGKDLIVFTLHLNDDKSVFIPANESAVLHLKPQDTVVFYTGKTLVSHADLKIFFKDNPYMSQLHIIDSLASDSEHYIDVHPEKIKRVFRGSTIMTKKEDSLNFKNIFFQKMTLQEATSRAFAKEFMIN